MKKVFASQDPAEVALVQSMLQAAGINSETRNESASQTLGVSEIPEVWIVNDGDFEEAQRLITADAKTV